MIDFTDIPSLYEDLSKVNDHMERLCRSDNHSMQEVVNWVLSIKGKQIRPILTLLCSKLKGKKVDVTELAAIIEICHTASLIHDDIIDDADKRRGQLSVQKKFGKEIAVYAGDFLIFVTLGRTNLRLKPWYREMFQNLEGMCNGELSQYDNRYNTEINEQQYIENIIGKTSSMFCIACNSGAFEGGCSEEERKAVNEFAVNLGILFQMRDDIIDYVSSKDSSSKTVQNDFWSGYYTLPAIYTFSHPVYGNKLKQIARAISIGEYDQDVNRILRLINLSQGFQYTCGVIHKYVLQAEKALSIFPSSKAKTKLIELVDYLWSTTPRGI